MGLFGAAQEREEGRKGSNFLISATSLDASLEFC